jgi:hypothetical protein
VGLIHTQKDQNSIRKAHLCELPQLGSRFELCERVVVSSSTGPHRQASRSSLQVAKQPNAQPVKKTLPMHVVPTVWALGAVALTGLDLSRDDGVSDFDALRGRTRS